MSENNCATLWCDYLHTQFDLAHLLSEMGFEIMQAVVIYIIWRKFIRPRFARKHREFDQAHGLTHETTPDVDRKIEYLRELAQIAGEDDEPGIQGWLNAVEDGLVLDLELGRKRT